MSVRGLEGERRGKKGEAEGEGRKGRDVKGGSRIGVMYAIGYYCLK